MMASASNDEVARRAAADEALRRADLADDEVRTLRHELKTMKKRIHAIQSLELDESSRFDKRNNERLSEMLQQSKAMSGSLMNFVESAVKLRAEAQALSALADRRPSHEIEEGLPSLFAGGSGKRLSLRDRLRGARLSSLDEPPIAQASKQGRGPGRRPRGPRGVWPSSLHPTSEGECSAEGSDNECGKGSGNGSSNGRRSRRASDAERSGGRRSRRASDAEESGGRRSRRASDAEGSRDGEVDATNGRRLLCDTSHADSPSSVLDALDGILGGEDGGLTAAAAESAAAAAAALGERIGELKARQAAGDLTEGEAAELAKTEARLAGTQRCLSAAVQAAAAEATALEARTAELKARHAAGILTGEQAAELAKAEARLTMLRASLASDPRAQADHADELQRKLRRGMGQGHRRGSSPSGQRSGRHTRGQEDQVDRPQSVQCRRPPPPSSLQPRPSTSPEEQHEHDRSQSMPNLRAGAKLKPLGAGASSSLSTPRAPSTASQRWERMDLKASPQVRHHASHSAELPSRALP